MNMQAVRVRWVDTSWDMVVRRKTLRYGHDRQEQAVKRNEVHNDTNLHRHTLQPRIIKHNIQRNNIMHNNTRNDDNGN